MHITAPFEIYQSHPEEAFFFFTVRCYTSNSQQNTYKVNWPQTAQLVVQMKAKNQISLSKIKGTKAQKSQLPETSPNRTLIQLKRNRTLYSHERNARGGTNLTRTTGKKKPLTMHQIHKLTKCKE